MYYEIEVWHGLGVFAAQIEWRQYRLNSLAFVVAALMLLDSGYAPINSAE